jgi:hypothetical protein
MRPERNNRPESSLGYSGGSNRNRSEATFAAVLLPLDLLLQADDIGMRAADRYLVAGNQERMYQKQRR